MTPPKERGNWHQLNRDISMKSILTAGAALLLSTSIASAGGLDRSGQGVGALFEAGQYFELSYGMVTPSVSGLFGGVVDSGSVAPAYTSFGFAIKTDINDQVSLALIMDQPFGASVEYPLNGYPLEGTTAEVSTTGLTALARYKFNDAFSVHAGVRSITASGSVAINGPGGGNPDYAATFDSANGVGYVVGAAFEKPEIAMRVALTYSSAVDLSLPTTLTTPAAGPVAPTDVTLPQSLNLDVQTGIAANTLLMGSVRWTEWTVTELNPFGYPSNPLLSYDNDVLTYSLGVGRKFSDQFSGSVMFGYEEAQGGLASNLSPTDGYTSVQIGGAYTLDNGVKISGGVRYVLLGDATTETIGAAFTDNTALGIGLKVGVSF